MARPLRIEYADAVYHITSRGNARQKIFRDDDDKEKFLEVLGTVIKRYHWFCHAYCLMDNHYHLPIETLEANLSKGFKDLLTDKTEIKEIPRRQRYTHRAALSEIFKSGKTKKKAIRNQQIHIAHLKLGYTLKEIADYLRIHYTTVSKALKGGENRN